VIHSNHPVDIAAHFFEKKWAKEWEGVGGMKFKYFPLG